MYYTIAPVFEHDKMLISKIHYANMSMSAPSIVSALGVIITVISLTIVISFIFNFTSDEIVEKAAEQRTGNFKIKITYLLQN